VAAQRKDNGDQPPRYLQTAEVAAMLHVSPKTVARWAKEGKLPFMRTLGGHRRYPEAKIQELLDQLRDPGSAVRRHTGVVAGTMPQVSGVGMARSSSAVFET
jgi:excisionase family DNA binding protein